MPKRPRESASPPPSSPPSSPPSRTYAIECMSFDGVQQSIEAPPPSRPLGGGDGLTVSAWVKRSRTEASGLDRLIDFGNGAREENIVINFGRHTMNYETHHAPPSQRHILEVAAAAPDGSFPEARWTHVAVVHQADGVASIFWDGSLKARGAVLLPSPVARSKYYVGKSHWGDDPYFKGTISEVYVFDYALSAHELRRCAHGRSMARAPVLSIAGAWRAVASPPPPLKEERAAVQLAAVATRRSGLRRGGEEAARGGGGGGVQREDLQFLLQLTEEQRRASAEQLEKAHVLSNEHVAALEKERAESLEKNAMNDVHVLTNRIDAARDALRRTQAVVRLIKYGHRIQQGIVCDEVTGQSRQPPRLAACLDASSGLFHAFAIYELRSSPKQPLAAAAAAAPAASDGSDSDASTAALDSDDKWHVYIKDVVSMRQLLPMQTVWREGVGSMLIACLQHNSEAEHKVVVLKALCEAPELETYYERIGFTHDEGEFESAGLRDYYCDGEMVRR